MNNCSLFIFDFLKVDLLWINAFSQPRPCQEEEEEEQQQQPRQRLPFWIRIHDIVNDVFKILSLLTLAVILLGFSLIFVFMGKLADFAVQIEEYIPNTMLMRWNHRNASTHQSSNRDEDDNKNDYGRRRDYSYNHNESATVQGCESKHVKEIRRKMAQRRNFQQYTPPTMVSSCDIQQEEVTEKTYHEKDRGGSHCRNLQTVCPICLLDLKTEEAEQSKSFRSGKENGDVTNGNDTHDGLYVPSFCTKVVQSKVCPHVFHEECIIQWLARNNNACPFCRKDLWTMPKEVLYYCFVVFAQYFWYMKEHK